MPPPPPEPESSDDLTLRTGETTTIRLPGLATAGYRWEAVVDDDAVLEVSTDFEPGDIPPAGAATSNRDELLEVRAREAGTTTVRLRQRRPWEAHGEAAAERELRVNVVASDDTSGEENAK